MIALAARRWSVVDLVQRSAEHFGGRGLVDVAVLGERLQQAGVAGEVRHDPQFDLRIVRRDSTWPGGAMKAWRMRRPSAVRIGMFCRLGSVDERRPVAATAW